MRRGICYVVGAGECGELTLNPEREDFVIAVDGGYENLKGQRIDLVVGDFDSLPYVPDHPRVIRLKPEKDDTDMMIALREGLAAGYDAFHIYGGEGGRFDHTLANIQCLAYLADQGARGYLIGARQTATLIQNDSISFSGKREGYISVFSYGERALGVTLRGLKYPLTDAELSDRIPLGVSNEFTGRDACISVGNGRLVIVYDNRLYRCGRGNGRPKNNVLQKKDTAVTVPAGWPEGPRDIR